MAGKRCCLGGHPLHQIAVRDDAVGVVVDDVVARTIEGRREETFRDSHANTIGEALPEGTGGDVDARGVQPFWMARRLRPQLAEVSQLVERQIVASDVQQTVKQGRAMTGGEDEAVTIRPLRIPRVELQELCEEDVGHGSGPEGQTGVAGISGLDRVDREDAEGVDRFSFKLAIERGGSDGGQENLLERRRGERQMVTRPAGSYN